MNLRRLCSSLAAMTAAIGVLSAQSQSASLWLQLDVIATSRDGTPIRDLTMADFQVSIGGKRIPAPAFAVIRNQQPHAWIVLIDDELTPLNAPAAFDLTRTTAQDVLERLGPEDFTAVLFTTAFRTGGGFFAPSVARSLLDKIVAGPNDHLGRLSPAGIRLTSRPSVERALTGLERAVDLAAKLPIARKHVFYISSGSPLNFTSIVRLNTWTPPELALTERLRRVVTLAAQARVAIHTIDPLGPNGLRDYLEAARRRTPGVGTDAERVRDEDLSHSYAAFLAELAEYTGGYATRQADGGEQIRDRVLRESSGWYQLSFVPPPGGRVGQFRRIEVRVNRRGAVLTVRRGFWS
jgi:VWFA-related protein